MVLRINNIIYILEFFLITKIKEFHWVKFLTTEAKRKFYRELQEPWESQIQKCKISIKQRIT